jgi:hypothetical protein
MSPTRPPLIAIATGALIGLAAACGTGSSSASPAREWLPKLEEENAFVCKQDVCDTAERRAALTKELADDARAAGGDYEPVAALADRASLAYRYWEQDCYPDGSYSSSAGMTCDEAWDFTIHGTDELEQLVRGIARAEEAG